MSRRMLALGIVIGLAVAGCIAAITADGEFVPVEVGGNYSFRSNGLTSGITGTVTEVLQNGWVVLDSGYMVNMKVTQFVNAQ